MQFINIRSWAIDESEYWVATIESNWESSLFIARWSFNWITLSVPNSGTTSKEGVEAFDPVSEDMADGDDESVRRWTALNQDHSSCLCNAERHSERVRLRWGVQWLQLESDEDGVVNRFMRSKMINNSRADWWWDSLILAVWTCCFVKKLAWTKNGIGQMPLVHSRVRYFQVTTPKNSVMCKMVDNSSNNFVESNWFNSS